MANSAQILLKDILLLEELDSESIRKISHLIVSEEITILHLIENLQTDLLHIQAAQRCKAVFTIVLVLENVLSSVPISSKEIELMTEFFCSKLKDHHSILPPALHGLHALATAESLPTGQAKIIVQSIFQDVHCQSQLQSDRRRVYNTLKHLLTYKLEELQILGQDLVFGLIQAADQERDPRNLLILFSLFPIVAKYFKLEPFAEEFFEVFSCYFPIDFSAPADDPYGVTKEQLSDGLRQCLASSAQFAEFCLPLLHEKLDSDVVSAKVEALKALESCCQTYHSDQLDTWIDMFWTSIRREVLINVNTDELEHAALDALTALSRAFTTEEDINITAFVRVLQNILKECLGHLCEPERRLMTPSSHILLAICAGSSPACKLIMSQVILLLLDQFGSRTQSTPRQFILHTLNKMVHAGLYNFTKFNVVESGVEPFATTLIDLYLRVLNEEDDMLRSLSLQGLSHFLGVRLSMEELEKINQTLLFLLDKPKAENISGEVCQFFRKSAENCEDWTIKQVLPKLFQMIESGNSKAALLVMSGLPSKPLIRAQLVPRLMDLLEQHPGKLDVISGVLQVLTTFSEEEGSDMFQHFHAWALRSLTDGKPPPYLSATCAILRNLSSSLNSSDVVEFIRTQVDQYINEHLVISPWTVMIMEATLGSLDGVPDGHVTARLLKALNLLAIGQSQDDVRISACRLIAALINKFPEGSEFEGLLNSLDQTSANENTVCLNTWVTKALVMRSYTKVNQSIQKLVDSLNDPTYGYLVAEGFKTILSETTECLNFNSHAHIKLMYKQRFFQEVVPRLLDLYQKNESCNKASVFAAIANQLAFIPQGVLLAHMATLIPLLIQCLAVEQPDELIISTINALLSLMADNTSSILDYIDNLVSRLLTLAKDGRTWHVRRLALKGLSELRKAPQIVLLPLRSQVIFQLVPCLGDRKRLVRREAALARQKWVMLGQPGGQ